MKYGGPDTLETDLDQLKEWKMQSFRLRSLTGPTGVSYINISQEISTHLMSNTLDKNVSDYGIIKGQINELITFYTKESSSEILYQDRLRFVTNTTNETATIFEFFEDAAAKIQNLKTIVNKKFRDSGVWHELEKRNDEAQSPIPVAPRSQSPSRPHFRLRNNLLPSCFNDAFNTLKNNNFLGDDVTPQKFRSLFEDSTERIEWKLVMKGNKPEYGARELAVFVSLLHDDNKSGDMLTACLKPEGIDHWDIACERFTLGGKVPLKKSLSNNSRTKLKTENKQAHHRLNKIRSAVRNLQSGGRYDTSP